MTYNHSSMGKHVRHSSEPRRQFHVRPHDASFGARSAPSEAPEETRSEEQREGDQQHHGTSSWP